MEGAGTNGQAPATVQVTITGLGTAGEGVGRVVAGPQEWVGRACFLPGALPGEEVTGRVQEVHPRYLRADLVDLLRVSPDRVRPPCPVYAQCGGCQLQHLSYEAQLAWKRQLVVDALRHIGRIDNPPVEACLPAENPSGYRNKVQMPVAAAERTVRLGFYRRASHDVVDVDGCLVQPDLTNRLVACLRRWVLELHIQPYDEHNRRGDLRHILVRVSRRTGEVLVVLVTRTEQFDAGRALAERLAQEFPELVGVIQNIQPSPGNVVLGEQDRLLWGRPYLHEILRVQVASGQWVERRFQISAHSFFQVNSAQAERLIEVALAALPPQPQGQALDLYCGAGAFTLFLAARFAFVIGMEEVVAAVQDAWRNARLNQVSNVDFWAGRVERILPSSRLTVAAALVDPPRAGMDREAVKALARLAPPRVVYVSCNPATLARDLQLLLMGDTGEGGTRVRYRLEKVQPVDMFPLTAHVEAVAVLVADRG
ncbi:MAG: 23S rRNA (uracil(1939)-C(5))-methyltransferase RlmD [Limnochordaceae bacterium]|nr:23S rRNA (uracil(1939)-C(5))-methyltransferase RlmD [Limnochordaceae bacterium]